MQNNENLYGLLLVIEYCKLSAECWVSFNDLIFLKTSNKQ